MKKSKNKDIELKEAKDDSNLVPSLRKGWDAASQEMRANDDDRLLIDDVFENEDFEEWNGLKAAWFWSISIRLSAAK